MIQQIWKTQQWPQDWKRCFYSNPKERQCQRRLKLPHNCTHLTCEQNNAQNSPSQASTVHELWSSRYSSWIYKKQRNQRSNWQHPLGHRKSKRVPENIYFALLSMPKPLTVWITTNWKILKEMWRPDHLTCLLRNLYAGQEATARIGHGTTDWIQIRKGVRQASVISSPYLYNLYAQYIMWNDRLIDSQGQYFW